MDDIPVSAVTLQVLNGLIEAQTNLRDAAEKRWAFAREGYFNLARLVAADWLEERQRQKGGLDMLRIEELAQVVYARVLALHAAHSHPDAQRLERALLQIEGLRADVEKYSRLSAGLKNELEAALSQIEELKKQAEGAKTKPAPKAEKTEIAVVVPEPPAEPNGSETQPLPIWYRQWAESAGFDRQSFVLRMVGERGTALRGEISKLFSDQFTGDETSGAYPYVLTRLAGLGWMYQTSTGGGANGRPPNILQLTHLGESAYTMLTGKKPVKGDYEEMRTAHSTDAHTVLILKASSLLETNGYEIKSKVRVAFDLPDGRVSSPDILAVSKKDGQEIHVEVERDTGKGDLEARERKWQNAFDAGQGCLYVICENPGIQKTLVQEIFRALASEGRLERVRLYMTNLEVLNTGQKHPDGSIWVFQKHKKKGARFNQNDS